jgi:hypothetical protein
MFHILARVTKLFIRLLIHTFFHQAKIFDFSPHYFSLKVCVIIFWAFFFSLFLKASPFLSTIFSLYLPSNPPWLLYVPPLLEIKISAFPLKNTFLCCVWVSEQDAVTNTTLTDLTRVTCIKCAVRNKSLNITQF